MIYSSATPIFSQLASPENNADWDRDGITDQWENSAIQALNPVLEHDEKEELFKQPDHKVVMFTRVTPIEKNGERYILSLHSAAYTRDYGTPARPHFQKHNGDTSNFQLVWKVIDPYTIELVKVWSRGHTRPGRQYRTFDAPLNELEFTPEGRLKIFIEQHKHGNWASRRQHSEYSVRGYDIGYDAPNQTGLILAPAYNVGEENAPFIDDISWIFPGEAVWSGRGEDRKFCGGLECEGRSPDYIGNALKNELVNDIYTKLPFSSPLVNWRFGSEEINLLTGGLGSDILSGGVGNDILYGRSGKDWLFGGSDDDTYLILNADEASEDEIIEYPNQEIDTVLSYISYDLPDSNSYNLNKRDIENLYLQGFEAINGYGNNLNNYIIGNDNNNSLSGDIGNDTLEGRYGDDSLNGEGSDDIIFGGFGDDHLNGDSNWRGDLSGGNDTIYGGSGNDSLGGGNANDYLSGGSDNDSLEGGFGNNYLDGGLGNDHLDGWLGENNMYGGNGDDTYIVNSLRDVIVEYIDEGIDSVEVAFINYSLGENLENLNLTILDAKGYGNNLKNIIQGNTGNDSLWGALGNDTLNGNDGNDIIVGDYEQSHVRRGHTYLLSTAATREEAQAEAQLLGGNLVTVNNAAEQAWLYKTFGTSTLPL